MNVALVLTQNCNLACKYCYAGKKIPIKMSEDVAKAAIDMAFATKKQTCRPDQNLVQVSFFGGEPLLAFEQMKLAVKYAKLQAKQAARPLRFAVTTNATLFGSYNLFGDGLF